MISLNRITPKKDKEMEKVKEGQVIKTRFNIPSPPYALISISGRGDNGRKKEA